MSSKAEQIAAWHRDFVGQHRLEPKPELEESQVVARLTGMLERSGWQCEREVWLPGKRLRTDLVIRHPHLPFPGIVECKARIAGAIEATAALKQAADYVGNRLPDGETIAFGAVCPWQPPASAECGSGCTMWGMLHIMATQFKVFAFISDEQFARWEMARGKRYNLRFNGQRLRLMYTDQNRIWCSEKGFVSNALHLLGGKRQIGGSRQSSQEGL